LSTEKTAPTLAERFVERLEELAPVGREDRASLAQLKRCAGRPIAECGGVMPLFYRLLPGSPGERAEEDFFLVATLFPLTTRRWTGDLGRSLRLLRNSLSEAQRDGVDRRLAVLLDAPREELPFRLRQTVRLLAQNELPLDWRALLRDLRIWDHPERYAQKRWARSYFGWAPKDTAGAGAGASDAPGTTSETEDGDAD
jgi:CRISPR system Cascade subunit CasB